MGYESLSTIIVLAIVGILMTIWLPRRTARGMKQVIKHQEDKFSTSLHLVDASSGTRFSDGVTAKGVLMPAAQTRTEKKQAYIARVREQRRESIRRRKIVVLSLLVVFFVVLALSFVVPFSGWFALIPAALLAAVLALGARASQQARVWEDKVARDLAKERKREHAVHETKKPVQHASKSDDEEATHEMEQREIRQALRRAQLQKAEVLAKKKAHEEQVAQHSQLVIREEELHFPADDTAQVQQVTASTPSKPFDGVLNQDLISFSLGQERNGVEIPAAAPESLEIKSTKQVAKAEPVEQQQETVSTVNDSEAFHKQEEEVSVEAPQASDDSLGMDLESILVRRGN